METYCVVITGKAKEDIANLYRYIAVEKSSPFSAVRYVDKLYKTICGLAGYGASLAVSQRAFLLLLYGPTVRTVSYHKMTIVYTVNNRAIYIQRVMPGALIR